MSVITATEQAIQVPGESILYSADFTQLLADDETISSVTSIEAEGENDDITISDESNDDKHIFFRVEDGTAGETYRVRATIVTSGSNTRIADMIIEMVNR